MYIFLTDWANNIREITLLHTAECIASAYERIESFGKVVTVEKNKESATSSLFYIGQSYQGDETQIQHSKKDQSI